MFSGLVQEVATIDKVVHGQVEGSDGALTELRVKTGFGDLKAGESIAVNGACLTVSDFGAGWFSVQAMGSTLSRTTIASWKPGTRVNLERAMSSDSRFGGHIVQGHVDCVGNVVATRKHGGAILIDVQVPGEFDKFLVLHGSITVDGVSLTINEFPKPDTFQVALIEFTLQHTTLSSLETGSRVHLESDIIGKYVQRAMEPYMKGISGA